MHVLALRALHKLAEETLFHPKTKAAMMPSMSTTSLSSLI